MHLFIYLFKTKTYVQINMMVLRGQTYSILELASILKEKEPENLTCSWTQAAPKYQEGPHGLSLARVTP